MNEHQLGGGDDHLSSDYRNSAEFELEGDFIDPDNLDVLVSTMTNNAAGPVTLTSQPLQVPTPTDVIECQDQKLHNQP